MMSDHASTHEELRRRQRRLYYKRVLASALGTVGSVLIGAVFSAIIATPDLPLPAALYLAAVFVGVALVVAMFTVDLTDAEQPEFEALATREHAESAARDHTLLLAEVRSLRVEVAELRSPWWKRVRRAR